MMQPSMKDLLLVAALSVFFTPTDASESSTLTLATRSAPWTQPCSLTAILWDGEMVTVATTGIPVPSVDIMIVKNRQLKRLVGRIQNKMILRFNDSSITSQLQKREMPGFPVCELSNTQNATKVYENHFTDLSKAAVYLEQVYEDENQVPMKRKLDSLISDNLSQLCELQLALHIVNGLLADNIRRDILPDDLRQMRTTYNRYVRDFLIITKYRDLLRAHDYHYSRLNKMM